MRILWGMEKKGPDCMIGLLNIFKGCAIKKMCSSLCCVHFFGNTLFFKHLEENLKNLVDRIPIKKTILGMQCSGSV